MPLPTFNRRQTSVRQQRRRLLLLPLMVTVLALATSTPSLVLAGLTTSSPSALSEQATTTGPMFAFDALQALKDTNSNWQTPCGLNGHGSVGIVPDVSINKKTKSLNMERQINLTLLDLNNWRELPGSNYNATTWNDTIRKRQFRFLRPLENRSTWERRLSVYWAHLKLVRLFHEKYSETNINQEEADALESVNEATRQLLCMVQEYHDASKGQRKPYDAVAMNKTIQFNIRDASEIKIHIWYIMCRLECFLTNMRKRLPKFGVKRANKPKKNMSCKLCPYGKKNQHKPLAKQQRKQGQHLQPSQHKRTGHSSAQQRQHQQQQQQQHRPSKQPKGRKGTRKSNVHARNRQA
uniref:Uncharacterized protein n=1 Tax=Anopheles culicifacies TaxID=139723 RepID=A0A182LYX3_9DIPT